MSEAKVKHKLMCACGRALFTSTSVVVPLSDGETPLVLNDVWVWNCLKCTGKWLVTKQTTNDGMISAFSEEAMNIIASKREAYEDQLRRERSKKSE